MTGREIRRLAHQAVAALLNANIEAHDGDLFVDAEDLTEAEEERFTAELESIQRYHARNGGDRS